MSIVNRRNAVLGWSVWTIGKRIAKRKAKPSVEGGRPNKPLWALAIAGTVGALTFWRRHRDSES